MINFVTKGQNLILDGLFKNRSFNCGKWSWIIMRSATFFSLRLNYRIYFISCRDNNYTSIKEQKRNKKRKEEKR